MEHIDFVIWMLGWLVIWWGLRGGKTTKFSVVIAFWLICLCLGALIFFR